MPRRMHERVLADAEHGRGPHGAPPEGPRPPGGAALAVGVILTVVGGAAFLSVRAARAGSGAAAPARAAPFDPGPLTGVAPTGEPAPVPRPSVLLYVDDACPYCAVELERWAEAFGRGEAVLPTVIVSPRSDPRGSHVPVPLRAGMLHDPEGRIGRALGVRAVPFRAVLDASGVVTGVHLGATPPQDLRSLPTPARSRRRER